jgi:hypothetical protein
MSTTDLITRRHYLTIKALESGAGLILAIEAVASAAIEHPEWRMDERRSYPDWEADARRRAE